MQTLAELGKAAKQAALAMMNLDTGTKNAALLKVADALEAHADVLLNENAKDVAQLKEKGGSSAFIDRLTLTRERIGAMASGVREVVELPDPVGEVTHMTKRPNGLMIGSKRVPLGVIGIIYEARPNVTVDAAALCLKTANACILRGGSEAIHSNLAIASVMREALEASGMPEACVQLLEDTSRETAAEMMRLHEWIDVLIPRGGKNLIQSVVQNATVPVIETGTGNCHIYIEKTADLAMGARILANAKTSRPAVCNAAESLLVDEAVAKEALLLVREMLEPFGVEIRGCEKTRAILPEAVSATEEDYDTEYNDYILSVKVVKDLEEAVAHINQHGTGHSEAIVTRDYFAANQFLDRIDAAAVYVNASTRFTDGNEFGFGAEIGISTQKLHARGPLGLKELTTNKYIIYGTGQIRG